MNKTAIKNFAIWARNKLIADISYKAGLLGITEKGIKSPLPQSTQTVQFFDIGTKEPNSITGIELQQRKKLVEEIDRKAKQIDYATAYKNVIEEVAYTWFNRLIAIRFMEVNDYLPTRIRVLSSESNGKAEPDLVTHALEANLDYSAFEKDRIVQLKQENKLDELFRMLFIKQCNALNDNLPKLFEKTSDYTELLLNVSFTDKDGLVYHLVNDISEDDFNVSKEGQVEIIGWLYQYYNTEPKDETFALLKKNVKITKERIPAATQLFTPDWIVRYMVENSLGRLWLEGHPNDELKSNWKYYLDEVEQEKDVEIQLCKIRDEYRTIKPEDIKVIDPAMGSGHILVYAFDVLMQIYERYGYSLRDAARSIVENNLYGLDIDNRAYQLAYFAVMMKARQYNRRILNGNTVCHIFAIQESNNINQNHIKYFGSELSDLERNTAMLQIQSIYDTFIDAKIFGSTLKVDNYDWSLLQKFLDSYRCDDQMSIEHIGLDLTKFELSRIVEIGQVIADKYDVVITNPPYLGTNGADIKLMEFLKENYPVSKNDLFAVFIEKCNQMLKKFGMQALITQHTWMFTSSYEKLRILMLSKAPILTMAHLGTKAFEELTGEVVQTTAFVLGNMRSKSTNGIFIKLTDFTVQKEDEYITALINKNSNYYLCNSNNFDLIPGNPIAYWVPKNVAAVYKKSKLMSDMAEAKQGLATGMNDRFLRYWFEVTLNEIEYNACSIEDARESGKKWFPYNKGGENKKWYGNNDYVVNWENDGYEIRNFYDGSGKLRSRPQNTQYFFQPCITWSLTTSSGTFAAREKGSGFIFDINGMSLFCSNEVRKYLLGFLCSDVCLTYMNIINPSLANQSGDILKLPVIVDTSYSAVEELVNRAIEITKEDDDNYETSWDFKRHPLI